MIRTTVQVEKKDLCVEEGIVVRCGRCITIIFGNEGRTTVYSEHVREGL